MQVSLLPNKLHRPLAGKTASVVSWEFRKREQELVRTSLALSKMDNRFWLVQGSTPPFCQGQPCLGSGGGHSRTTQFLEVI